jgi:uncharacterized protein YwgA
MTNTQYKLDRIALIAHLIARAAPARLGRTALMKCLFFLKVIKQVPMPYSFGLYTYGPFDSDVLDDLQYAEALGAVESSLVEYPRARGYEYQSGPKLEDVEKQAREFLSRYEESIDWVLNEFGNRSAIDLEMASTLVYIDRVTNGKKAAATIAELAKKVHGVKPHLALDTIEREARTLKGKGLLQAAA